MNLFRRTCILKKFFLSLDKYSSYSTVRVDQETFQRRLLDFFKHFENSETEKVTSAQHPRISESSEKIAISHSILIQYLKIYADQDSNKFSIDALRDIDNKSCQLLGKISSSKILQLLLYLMRVQPNHVTRLKFYSSALLALKKFLADDKLTTQEILLLLYFESFRNKRGNVKYILNSLPAISSLSLLEQCMMAQSAYRCGVKLKTEDLKTLEDLLENKPDMLVKDPAVLVTVCKAVRHGGPVNCELTNLSTAVLNSDETFTITCAAHTLSLYAEANVQCPDVLQRFFDDFLKNLEEEKREMLITTRLKDFDRLLWASRLLDYKLRESDTKEIISFIDRRYSTFLKNPAMLTNILLSLWMLKCTAKNKLVERCLEDGAFKPIVDDTEIWWKLKARLNLLISCVKIEAPEIKLPYDLKTAQYVGLKRRDSVEKLWEIIAGSKVELGIRRVGVDCPVTGIYIPGVTISDEKRMHVDLLDDSNCFKGTDIPSGFLKLKLRLLPKIGYRSILVCWRKKMKTFFDFVIFMARTVEIIY